MPEPNPIRLPCVLLHGQAVGHGKVFAITARFRLTCRVTELLRRGPTPSAARGTERTARGTERAALAPFRTVPARSAPFPEARGGVVLRGAGTEQLREAAWGTCSG